MGRPTDGSALWTQGTLVMAQDIDEFEFFLDKPWSDGLPVVTPTEVRVQRMLQGTPCAPDEVVGLIPPCWSPPLCARSPSMRSWPAVGPPTYP
jgi:hypothetical protein